MDAAEGGATGLFTVHRSSDVGALTVNYAGPTGTATNAADYSGAGSTGGSVGFAYGDWTKSIVITAVDDTLLEAIETVTLALAGRSGYAITGVDASININDNDLPDVWITGDTHATEGGATGLFTVHRSSGVGELNVGYDKPYGTATNGADYSSIAGNYGGAVGFVNGELTKSIIINPVDDALAEGTETVFVLLSGRHSGYTISGYTASIDINDNDGGAIAGTVWDDSPDRDRVRESPEALLGGLTVILRNSAHNSLASSTTDVVGHYSFTGLANGNYTVQVLGTTSNAGDETAMLGVVGGQVAGSIGLPSLGTPVNQKPMATGKRDGIDWSTLDMAKGTPNTFNEVTGKNFEVKTSSGLKTIKVFLADAMAKQPQTIQDKNPKPDLGFNCHGYAFNTRAVVDSEGETRDFAIIDLASPQILLSDQYKNLTATQAKDELAADKKPITVFLSFIFLVADEPGFGKKGDLKAWHIHSAVPTIIILDGNNADKEKTLFTSKNGFDPLKVGMTLSELQTLYPQPPRTPLAGKPTEYQFYILK